MKKFNLLEVTPRRKIIFSSKTNFVPSQRKIRQSIKVAFLWVLVCILRNEEEIFTNLGFACFYFKNNKKRTKFRFCFFEYVLGLKTNSLRRKVSFENVLSGERNVCRLRM